MAPWAILKNANDLSGLARFDTLYVEGRTWSNVVMCETKQMKTLSHIYLKLRLSTCDSQEELRVCVIPDVTPAEKASNMTRTAAGVMAPGMVGVNAEREKATTIEREVKSMLLVLFGQFC